MLVCMRIAYEKVQMNHRTYKDSCSMIEQNYIFEVPYQFLLKNVIENHDLIFYWVNLNELNIIL